MTAAKLRREVLDANLALARSGLVAGTFGNVSGIDRAADVVAIKPSGVPYDQLTAAKIVLVSLKTGNPLAGSLRPSSDLPTHLELYRAFKSIGGVSHTHSIYASAWAQAGRAIPPMGTTHADHFAGPVPCTRPMRPAEVRGEYERNTGLVIVERFTRARLDPADYPAVLVASHGPFTWGASAGESVANAIMLEYCAQLATLTLRVNPSARPMPAALLAKHFSRKHGPRAYYGQR